MDHLLAGTALFALLSMLLIESIPADWKKAIGGAILIIAALTGALPEW